MSNIKTIIIFSLIFSFVLPIFVLAQVETPGTIEGTKEFGKEFLEKSGEQLPGILERIWREGVLPVWRKMYEIWSNWWDFTIQPWLKSIWQRIKGIFIQEIEKRKPYIEEEFQKEKEELKEEVKKELPKTGKSLWQRFKELIK